MINKANICEKGVEYAYNIDTLCFFVVLYHKNFLSKTIFLLCRFGIKLAGNPVS